MDGHAPPGGRAGLLVARQPRQQARASRGCVRGWDPRKGSARGPEVSSRLSASAGGQKRNSLKLLDRRLLATAGAQMPAPAAKGAGRGGPRGLREGTSSEERATRAPAAKPPGPGATPSPEGRAAMPHPRAWGRPLEMPAVRQDLLLGVLKAAEARGRIRALRLRYIRLRAEATSLLIQQQESARAAIRLELFLPPQLKPTRIPDPLDRQERRRVETILEEKAEGSIFPR
ncbi:protein LKAAEAR1 isoform X1 [Canis lupus baileyi]|uniref:protein LKAAEAR1 isoform X1 n=2 Tax=Canis lupus baileyi TaxID=143281 RepID=UPI003B96E908